MWVVSDIWWGSFNDDRRVQMRLVPMNAEESHRARSRRARWYFKGCWGVLLALDATPRYVLRAERHKSFLCRFNAPTLRAESSQGSPCHGESGTIRSRSQFKPVWTPSRIQQAGTLHSAAQSSYICKVSWRPETPDVEEGQFWEDTPNFPELCCASVSSPQVQSARPWVFRVIYGASKAWWS